MLDTIIELETIALTCKTKEKCQTACDAIRNLYELFGVIGGNALHYTHVAKVLIDAKQ